MIRGQGMPSYRHHNPGNMYIKFDIEFPTQTPSLGGEQRALLKGVLGLPPSKPLAKGRHDANGMDVDEDHMELDALTPEVPPNVAEDDCDLEDVDHNNQQRANRAMVDDEDEDGVPHGAERMQCASQ